MKNGLFLTHDLAVVPSEFREKAKIRFLGKEVMIVAVQTREDGTRMLVLEHGDGATPWYAIENPARPSGPDLFTVTFTEAIELCAS